MKSLIFFLQSVVIILIAFPVAAATMRSGDTAIISVPINDDVYIAGGKVIVNQEIKGDAIGAGGNLLINGAVGQDLLIAGGNLVINAPVGDDVRAAGGDITINGNIADDLIVAGGSIAINRDVIIGGDLFVSGGIIILDGIVEGNMKVAGGEVVFNGNVKGNADIHGGKLKLNGNVKGKTIFSATEVTLGQTAGFGGDVNYWRPEGEMDFGTSIAGTATYTPELKGKFKFARDSGRKAVVGVLAAWLAFSILSGALIILVLVLLTRNFFNSVVERLLESFWENFGLGFLYFIVTPIIVLLLFITIIGLPLGLFLLFVYLSTVYFSTILTAMVMAKWFEQKKKVQWSKVALFFVSLGVFIVLKLLMLIPVIGGITVAVFVCASLGAMIKTKWKLSREVV